jgi:MSHA pilin protein MshA
MKKQSGFTLIELVIVIVILGILAATALPRFADLTQDARIAALNGVAGSVRSAAAIGHATYLAKGLSSSGNYSADGVTINLVNGYPDAETISSALIDITGFTFGVTGGNTGTFTKAGAPTTTSCIVTYVESVGGNYPAISITSTGC